MVLKNISFISLYKAGYTDHPKRNGYVKQIGRSRFHILEENGEYDLHFDKTRNKIHYSRGHQDLLVGEIRRIYKINGET